MGIKGYILSFSLCFVLSASIFSGYRTAHGRCAVIFVSLRPTYSWCSCSFIMDDTGKAVKQQPSLKACLVENLKDIYLFK